MIHKLLCAAALLFLVRLALADKPPTSSPLTIQIKDSRPLPPNLIPVLSWAGEGHLGFGGPILPVTSGNDPGMWHNSLVAMQKVAVDTFVTTVPVERENLWLLIDHPGYLRGYRTAIPNTGDPSSTVTVKLPARGGMLAELNLVQFQRDANSNERWQEALKGYCITAYTSRPDRFSYEITYHHCLEDWKFEVTDMAPGTYELFGSGRWCDATSGPAGYGGKANFEVKPGYTTKFIFPMVERGKFSHKETTPTITFKPL